jgi:uncharacterized repeat protein (TIGR01451 family)
MFFLSSHNQYISIQKNFMKFLSVISITGIFLASLPTFAFADGTTTPETNATTSVSSASAEGISGKDGTSTSGTKIQTGNTDSFSSVSNNTNNNTLDLTASSSLSGLGNTSNASDTNTASGTQATTVSPQASTTSAALFLATTTDSSTTSAAVVSNASSTGLGNIATSTNDQTNVSFSNTNNSTGSTTATTTAESGVNIASSTASSTATTTIQTGDASAFLDILNNVNNSLLNSGGVLQLISGNNINGNINLQTSGNGTLSDQLSALLLENMNNAKITNKAIVVADTGRNSVCNPNGTTTIITGNAKAGANIVNFANNNFIDSQYAVLSANILGNLLGNLTLPGKEFFQKAKGLVVDNLHANLSNTGNATTSVSSVTQTGQNNATGTKDSSIQTGDSQSSSVIRNQSGTLGIGGAPLVDLVFNIGGAWKGNIYSLPDGITYTKTDTGFELTNAPQAISSATSTATTSSSGSSKSASFASSTINSTSSAGITNDVGLKANTGVNTACGGSANITTGNAVSSLTILNLFNMTFYGKNFLYGAVNVLGNWKGNVAFGQPDLAVLGRAGVDVTKKGAYPGSEVTYTYTLANTGGADATNVVFTDTLGKNLSLENLGTGQKIGGGKIQWNFPKIQAGQTKQVSYTVKVANNIPYGTTYAKNNSQISSYEPDANMGNNTEEVSIPLYRNYPQTSSGSGFSGNNGNNNTPQNTPKDQATSSAPDFQLTATNNTSGTTTASSTVNYKIVVDNNGGQASGAVLQNVLTDENGNIISKQHWNLDTVKANEEITITYGVFYKGNTLPGVYTSTDYVQYDGTTTESGAQLISPKVTSSVSVLPLVQNLPTEHILSTNEAVNDKSNQNDVLHKSASTSSSESTSTAKSASSTLSGVGDQGNSIAQNNLASAASSGMYSKKFLFMLTLTLLIFLYVLWRVRAVKKNT